MPCSLVSDMPLCPCGSCLSATPPTPDQRSLLSMSSFTPSKSLLGSLQAGNHSQQLHAQRGHLLPSLLAQLQAANPTMHSNLLLSSFLAGPMFQSLSCSTPTDNNSSPDLFDFLNPIIKPSHNSFYPQSAPLLPLPQLLSFIPVTQPPAGYSISSLLSDTTSPIQSNTLPLTSEYHHSVESPTSAPTSAAAQDTQTRSVSPAPSSTPTDATASPPRSHQKIRLSKQERDLLEQIYQECAVPHSDVIRKAAKRIGRKYRHIQYWFQNRRRKQRAL
ncbi:hypothetical protein BJ741DRAFT_91045 [Chytriomyces cf. hyalinus JEL632]|nr:hypothetical protein BJ741DRAFT_91045 [Chytriomyces cf. hyalinus JEL632]